MARRATETRVLRIPVVEGKPWVSACFLTSYLAYPEQTSEHEAQRPELYNSLLFWQEVRHMRGVDRTLCKKFMDKKYLSRTFNKGIKMLVHRLTAADSVMYHLFNLKTEDGLAPTVENLAQVQAKFLGSRSINSGSTYQTRKAGPSSAVLHVATAILLDLFETEHLDPLKLFFHFMFNHKALARLVALSNGLRLTLHNCRNIYHEDQFIKFEFISSTTFPSRETGRDDEKFRTFLERVRQLAAIK
jgi:hypothetical protein